MNALSFYHPLTYFRDRNRVTTPPIFLRDFAYTDNAPVVLHEPMRMAKGNINNASASTFAEYVRPFTS